MKSNKNPLTIKYLIEHTNIEIKFPHNHYIISFDGDPYILYNLFYIHNYNCFNEFLAEAYFRSYNIDNLEFVISESLYKFIDALNPLMFNDVNKKKFGLPRLPAVD